MSSEESQAKSHHTKLDSSVGIHKTTYELLTIAIFTEVPYPKSDHDILAELVVVKAAPTKERS